MVFLPYSSSPHFQDHLQPPILSFPLPILKTSSLCSLLIFHVHPLGGGSFSWQGNHPWKWMIMEKQVNAISWVFLRKQRINRIFFDEIKINIRALLILYTFLAYFMFTTRNPMCICHTKKNKELWCHEGHSWILLSYNRHITISLE